MPWCRMWASILNCDCSAPWSFVLIRLTLLNFFYYVSYSLCSSFTSFVFLSTVLSILPCPLPFPLLFMKIFSITYLDNSWFIKNCLLPTIFLVNPNPTCYMSLGFPSLWQLLWVFTFKYILNKIISIGHTPVIHNLSSWQSRAAY